MFDDQEESENFNVAFRRAIQLWTKNELDSRFQVGMLWDANKPQVLPVSPNSQTGAYDIRTLLGPAKPAHSAEGLPRPTALIEFSPSR